MNEPKCLVDEQEVYICIRQGIAIDMSCNFSMLTGYQEEEILGKDIVYILNVLLRFNKKILSADKITSMESCIFFNKFLDSKEISVQVLKDDDNDLTYLIFRLVPIININNPISYSNQLISNNSMGIALFNAEDYTLLKASKEYKRIMNERYHQSDIIGCKIYEFIQDWLDSPARKDWEAVIKNKKEIAGVEIPTLNPLSGEIEYFDTSIAPIMDFENVKFLLVTLNDVTEKVMYRQSLINQKEQLEAVMENMSDAIFIIDKNGEYLLQNKAALERFGLELKQVGDAAKYAKFYEMDGVEIPFEKMPEVLMYSGIETKDKVIHIKFLEKEMYVSVSATPIFDQLGNYRIGVLSSRDITEYIRRNETIKKQHIALLIAEKKEKENLENMIAMKDEFLSLISHEFKTPLTVINSALQTMDFLYKDQITDKVKAYLDKIKQNTFRQVRLVNNLLDITGAKAGHIKLNMKNRDIIFITKSITESVHTYAQQKGVNLSFESDIDEKIIAIDEEKYERILLNLLSNAIKFTTKDKSILVRMISQGEKVKLFVMDEGIGIPKEKQELIFEKFGQVDSSYTRQAEGSGIGLSLVKLMLKAMGGNISVESRMGVGSCFCVELPNLSMDEELNVEAANKLIDSRLIQSIAIEFSDIYF